MPDDITNLALDFISTQRQKPFFLFLNYMDVHSPYIPPVQYADLYSGDINPRTYRFKSRFKDKEQLHNTPQWNSFLLSQYDAEITFVDYEIGRLLTYLKKQNFYDSSLIVITSDHGELFGERGHYEHHHAPPIEGLMRIPLIIKYPGNVRTGFENGIINLTDVYPTLFTICGFPLPDGISGRPYGGPGQSGFAESFGLWVKESSYKVLYRNGYKYIRYMDNVKPTELYNLQKDPGEQENLFQSEDTLSKEMHASMQYWIDRHTPREDKPEEADEEVSGEVLENLKALGYVQ